MKENNKTMEDLNNLRSTVCRLSIKMCLNQKATQSEAMKQSWYICRNVGNYSDMVELLISYFKTRFERSLVTIGMVSNVSKGQINRYYSTDVDRFTRRALKKEVRNSQTETGIIEYNTNDGIKETETVNEQLLTTSERMFLWFHIDDNVSDVVNYATVKMVEYMTDPRRILKFYDNHGYYPTYTNLLWSASTTAISWAKRAARKIAFEASTVTSSADNERLDILDTVSDHNSVERIEALETYSIIYDLCRTEQEEQIIELKVKGATNREISKLYSCSEQYIGKVLKGIKSRYLNLDKTQFIND